MVHLSRFLAAALAGALLAGFSPAAQAQFFFGPKPPPRKAVVRHAPAPQPFAPIPVGEKASFHDTARFLAGLPVDENSPLARITRDPYWQGHAASFNESWRKLEAQRLSKIRTWSAANIKDRAGMPVYYMFSGPDFLYANAFYPNASTYILSGLEPVGRIPVINEVTRSSLGNLRASMASSISLSFFITKNMKHQLRETALTGTLPILMVYIARAGKTIDDITLVTLASDGRVAPAESNAPQRGAQGVKITFSGGADQPKQTLYYFSTDISDSGVKASGFLKFVDSFGQGDALFKAASYLPHSGSFAQVRDFILSKADYVVQDDSGIPVNYFKQDQWTLHPFGRYLGPIGLFPGRYQHRLAELYVRGSAKPIDWGMGYRWRTNESNVLLAVRKDIGRREQLRPAVSETAPAVKPEAVPAVRTEASAMPATTATVPASAPTVIPAAAASSVPVVKPEVSPALPTDAAQQSLTGQERR